LTQPQPLNRAVFPLSVKRIVIDPGHGGDEPGAVSSSGIAEKEITLDIALRLHRLMDEAPFDVLLTRHDDRAVPLSERATFANAHGGDIFVSIHVNWTNAPELRPLETYYLGPPNDPASIQVASRENRESDYSLASFRRLLEKIYLDGRRSESRNLAKKVQVELYQSLSQINSSLENRGVKTAPFAVLVETEMPAILVEVSCLSNEDEVRLLTNPDYRQQIARSLFRAIRSYAQDLNSADRKGS
jgi:N-acetylmuramoyl-L-alanine amidase